MADTKDLGEQQPEFERGLEAAATAGGQKPADQSKTPTPKTKPTPASLDDEEAEIVGILGAVG